MYINVKWTEQVVGIPYELPIYMYFQLKIFEHLKVGI